MGIVGVSQEFISRIIICQISMPGYQPLPVEEATERKMPAATPRKLKPACAPAAVQAKPVAIT